MRLFPNFLCNEGDDIKDGTSKTKLSKSVGSDAVFFFFVGLNR